MPQRLQHLGRRHRLAHMPLGMIGYIDERRGRAAGELRALPEDQARKNGAYSRAFSE
jgi:hypothetical protein